MQLKNGLSLIKKLFEVRVQISLGTLENFGVTKMLDLDMIQKSWERKCSCVYVPKLIEELKEMRIKLEVAELKAIENATEVKPEVPAPLV